MKNILGKVLVTSALISSVVMVPIVFAEDTGTGANTSGTTTTIKDVQTTNKEKLETLRAENKAKLEAARAEAKAKREVAKKEKEAFVLKQAQDRFAQKVADAEAAIVAAQAKLAEAKAAAAAATDRASFEKARALFKEARKLLQHVAEPLGSTPKIGSVSL